MKRILFIHVMALLCAVQSYAQNAIVGAGFSSGWGGGACPTGSGNFTYLSTSAGSTYIVTRNPSGTGNQYFRFGVDWSGTTAQLTNTIGSDVSVSPNTTYSLNTSCSTSGALFINCPNTTDNYIFKTLNAGTNPTGTWVFFRIQGAVQSVSSVTRSPSGTVFPGQDVTVTANLSAAFSTGQQAYIRYSTDGYTTSTVVAGSGTGTTRTFTIPASANTPGANLSYYIFTSGDSGPAANGSNADLYTININNNGGSNYTYTAASGWTTAATGNWSAAGTWTANAVPPTATNLGTVTLNHSVTQDANAVASSVVIGSGVTLTASANTLAINNNTSGTNFSNSGTLALTGTHAVNFGGTGTHTISGTSVFNNVNTTTGVNFGSGSTINGSFTLNAGGFVSTNSPTYGTSSTLTYNTGGVFGAGTEWTANALTGQGVPFNVTISTASTSVNFGASTQYRRLRGNLTLSASTFLALSTASGGDLRIGGNWTNSGTFTANARAVFFDGSAAQSIAAGGVSFGYLFISNTSATVTAATNVTVATGVNGGLTIDANARFDIAATTLTITSSAATVNGFLRSAGTITGASTTTLTFSSTGTYEHNYTTAAGTIPTATWNVASTCKIIGYTSNTGATGGLNQTFGNFTWDCQNQTSSVNLNGGLIGTIAGNFTMVSSGATTAQLRLGGSGTTWTTTINGDLIVQGGRLALIGSGTAGAGVATINVAGGLSVSAGLIDFNAGTNASAAALNVKGNFSQTGGTIQKSFAATATLRFDKASGTQTINQTAGTITNNINFAFGSGSTTNTIQLLSNLNTGTGSGTITAASSATVDFQTYVISGSGTFTASTGTTLTTANTDGINATGSTGSVQTTTRTFTNTGVNYSFNGSGAQAAGTAIGAATSIANLTVNNSAGLTLSASIQSLTGALTLTSGNLTLSTFDLNLSSAATVSGAASSKYVVTNSTGQMKRASLTTAFTFPVGNAAYNPISITNTGTSDTYGVIVSDGSVPAATVSSACVNRRWIVTEGTAGGGDLSVTAQYNTGETGGTYTTGSQVYVGLYVPTTWTTTTTTVSGSNPFTAAGSGFTQSLPTSGTTAYFAIGNEAISLALPTVSTTVSASSITNTTASSGGQTITGSALTAKGVVFSTAAVTTTPTLSNSVLTDGGTTTANFTSNLTSLSPETQYYVRAYATNAAGTGYASAINFYTLSNPATAQASSLSATATAAGTLSVSWTGASWPSSGAAKAGYALIYSTGTPTLSSTNGTAPAAGVGTLLTITPTGLPTTPATSQLIGSLTGGTTYNILLVPFTWDGVNAGTYNYLTASAPTTSAVAIGNPSITTTTAASSITNTDASSGGSSISANGGTISAKGVVWNTSTAPTTANSSSSDGTGTASFSSSLSSLSAQTLYYVRAYVTNEVGTAYGNEVTFRTLSAPAAAQATSLSGTVTASGSLTLDWTGATFPSSGATQGGYALVYSTGTPTLSSSNGSAPAAGVGTLITITPTNLPSAPATSYVLSGLTGGTTYNFLLVPFTFDGTNAATYNYLTTSAPTASATAVTTASVTTTAASSVSSSSASSGGSSINSGGGSISAKGVVWNTSTAPTTSNNLTSDGTGTSSFSSSLTSLNAQTQYYYRAYVTNDVGTVYGGESSFYTLSNEPTAEATAFTATSNGSSQIDLAWTAATFPGAGATNNGYIILRRIDSTNPTTSGISDAVAPAGLSLPSGTTLVTTITSGATTSFNHTGLSASTQYNYIIVPFTWNGSDAATYNYYLTSAPNANATTSAGLPTVDITVAASSITNNSASSGGNDLIEGGSAITAKGVAYNTTGTPTTADNTTSNGSGAANFTSSLTGLSAQTLYYARAYVTNSAGTGYGNEINFRTLSNPATAQASSLTATASASGELTISWTGATFPSSGATQGGYALIYSSGTPTLSSANGTAPAAGVGTLVTITPTNLPTAPGTSYVLTGLTSGTTYNFLLVPFTWDGSNASTYNYLTTSAPTASGTAVSPALVTSTAVSSITDSSASSGGSSITAGGGTISAKGVVWNTSTAPTTANGSTNDGTGTTSFSSSLTSLNAQTLYYTRAYVTNEIGTVYGNELTFRTLSAPATAQASSLSATASASGELTINWTGATYPSSGATQGGYALIYSTGTPTLSSANGAAPAAGVGTLVTITPTNLPSTPASSYVLSGLTGGTLYNFLLVPFTWDGTNATTYNYLATSAPTTSATAVATASVTTTAASSITNTSASSGGSAINAGGGSVSAKGVVWDTATAPTLANSSTNDGTGTAGYTSSVTALSPETLYYTRAYVTNDVGTAYGNEISFRTLSNAPTAQATGLGATATSSSNIDLSWTAATFPASGASVTGYVLLRATSPNTPSLGNSNGASPTAGANTTIVSSSISGAATTASSSGLAAITTYNYLLVPFTWDGANTSTYNYLTVSAPTASATTFASVPIAQPSSLAFSAVTATTITTSWTAAAGGPAGYIVLRSTGSAPNTDPVSGTSYTAGNTLGNATVVFVGSAVTTGAQTGLADGTTYFYEVYSYNGTGSTRNYLTTSPLSGSQATTAVSAPTATAGTSITDSGFTANWNSVSGASSYQLDVFPLTYDSFDNTSTLFAVTSGTASYFTGNTAAADGPSSSPYAVNGTHSLGKTNGSVTVTSSNINTTALSSPQLSFRLASISLGGAGNGADATDIVTVEVSPDGGNNYYSTVRVIGFSNAYWSYNGGTGVASTAYDGNTTPVDFQPAGGGTRTTDGYSTVTVTGLPSTASMRVRITLLNNSTGERWVVDNFAITPAPGNLTGYNSLTVSGTSQSVTGLASNTTYGYVVRAVGASTTSANSNTIAVTTLVGQSDADFRTIASGNFSTPGNWEYNNGSGWVTATQGPGSNNNTTVQVAHSITMDVAHTMNSGKTMLVNGALNTGVFVISGGIFTLASNARLTIGSADGIASTGATGNIQTTTRTFNAAANYIYAGSAAQITGAGLPTNITGSLAIQSGANTVTLTTIPTTTDSLSLQSGLFAIGTGATLNISAGGKVVAATGDLATGASGGTINFVGLGSFSGNCNPYNVYANNGVNFGSGTVTIQSGGTFRLNAGGYVDTNAPYYGSGSTLQYWINNVYGRNLEWSASSGRGYPHHVRISNNTILNPANTGATQASSPLRTAGNLTIDSGSAMYMDYGANNMIEDLVVGGDMILTGSLSASGASGSDIFVAGNWQNDGTTANFNANSRAVFLNGAGTQTISGTNSIFPAFPFLFIDKTAGTVALNRDVQVSTQLVFSSSNTANVSAGSFTLNVSGAATNAIDRQGSGHVIGNLRRGIGTGTNSYAYPVGDATNYTPVTMEFNNVTGAGNVTIKSNAGDQTQIGSSGIDSTLSVNRYYTISNNATVFSNYSATLNFVSGDRDAGLTTATMLAGIYTSSWSYPTVDNPTTTSIRVTGVTTTGDFIIGNCKTPATFNVTGGGQYCSGSGGVAVGMDGSEAGVTYQLKRDGVNDGSPVPGTGSAISFGNQTDAGTYTVVANSLASGICTSNMSSSAFVSVNAVVNPTISIGSTAVTICTGTSVTFTATPQFGGTSPVYQWKLNGSSVGSNSTTYSSSSLANGDIVICEMTSNEACPSPATVVSNSVSLEVLAYETPTITIGSSSGTTICAGDAVNFTSSTTFEGGIPTYDWRVNGVSAGDEAEFNTFALSNGDQISCILTSDYQCLTAPAASSNTLTITIVEAPQVEAGSNMTTCGTAPYTFGNGATNSNTITILWTENGAGSITAGANTLTPTYTPTAGDYGNVITFTLTGYGSSPCAEIADNVTLQVDGLTLYYNDADGDGFGDPLSSPDASCTPVAGKVADNTDCCDSNADINPLSEWWGDADGDNVGGFIFQTGCISGCSGLAQTIPYYPGAHGGAPYTIDCDDTQATSYPGASEICGDLVDNNCNITIDEGCSGIINDGFAFATLLNVNNTNAYYPNCQITNGSVLNADISAEGNPANVSATLGAGRDSWYRFVAPTTAAQIRVVPSGFDAVIELRTAAHPSGQVDVENVSNTIGGTEIMNISGLTPGQTYYVAVRNFDATTGGTFTICVAPLRASGCATAQPVSGLSLCSSFKAVYRGASSYTFNFTGTGGAAPTPFATTSATANNTTIIALSSPALGLRNGGVYDVRVDANFTLLNGAGVADPVITLQGTVCSRTIAPAPPMEVLSSQRCASSTLNRSALLRAVTTTGESSACSATGYSWRFTRVANCTGTAIPGQTPAIYTSTGVFLSLYVPFPNGTYPFPNIGYWKVEIAPIFSYGIGSYGPAQIIQVNNTASSAMLPEVAQSDERIEDIESIANVYPNPGNGDRVVVATNTDTVITNWNVIDELGRKVEGYRVDSADGMRYEFTFTNTLTNGLYYISWMENGEMKSERWMVSK